MPPSAAGRLQVIALVLTEKINQLPATAARAHDWVHCLLGTPTKTMKAAPLRVLVVGALTRTGQQVIRSLASRRDDFTVTALCGREMGALIADDTGTLADASMGVRFLGEGGGTATADAVDAVVIATDDPPPEASLQCLLESCSREGVAQTVLLSRIGASKGALGLGRWKVAHPSPNPSPSPSPSPNPNPNPNPNPKP